MIIGTYLPGYKAGGLVLSIANLIDCLGDEYEFSVLTFCCDLNEMVPYPDIAVEDWNTVGKARVFYTAGFTKDLIDRVAQGMDIVILSIVLRKFSFILNRLDYLIPGWALPVKDAPAHVCP